MQNESEVCVPVSDGLSDSRVRNPSCTTTKRFLETRYINGLSASDTLVYGAI